MQTHDLIGLSKSAIMRHFEGAVEFLHWLYLPTLGLILSFDKQICFQVNPLPNH